MLLIVSDGRLNGNWILTLFAQLFIEKINFKLEGTYNDHVTKLE